METFEETSRITNVSATMFPSLPWALVSQASVSYKRPLTSGCHEINEILGYIHCLVVAKPPS